MTALPPRNDVAGSPTRATARSAFGQWWDAINERLFAGGATSGEQDAACAALGAVRKTGDTMTGNLNVPSLNGAGFGGLRNKIINGRMEIAQRGVSFVAPIAGNYTLDRWRVDQSTSAVGTVTQNADVPSNDFQASLRYAVTTADSSIGASEFAIISQVIEGYNGRDLIGRTFTVSFWVRSSKVGTHCVAVKNSADRSYLTEYTISVANTWERKSVTVPGGLITAGTWNWTNGASLSLVFTLAAGSSFQAAAGSWQTGNYFGTSNQVNCLDTIGNIFAITGVQLEVGSVAGSFDPRPYGLELMLCQRYYEISGGLNFWCGQITSGNTYYHTSTYRVTKRAPPTVVANTVGQAGFGAGSMTLLSSNNPFDFAVQNISNATAGSGYWQYVWTAAAEL